MIKLSDKFSKNKIIIAILSILIIITGITIFFTKNVYLTENQNNTNIETARDNVSKYQYKSFRPTFKTTSESKYDDYDFTHDMKWESNIYHRKVNTYEEYSQIKARWNDILDMTENDFKDNFMVITAIENTSMLGLTVDNIETDNNYLYINLIHYEDGIEYIENETGISYIIPRTMERETICVTRNLRDSEKDMSNKLQLKEEKDERQISGLAFQYKQEDYRKLEERLTNTENSTWKLIPLDWKDIIYERFGINRNEPEIDLSTWNDLGDGFYSLAITKHSEYIKLMNNYSNIPKLSWSDFKYIYPIIIIRNNAERTIGVSDIEKQDNGEANVYVYEDGFLDVAEDFKYPAAIIYTPNYRCLEEYYLQVKLK